MLIIGAALLQHGLTQRQTSPASYLQDWSVGKKDRGIQNAGGVKNGVASGLSNEDKAAGGSNTDRVQFEQYYISKVQSLAYGYEIKLNSLVSSAVIDLKTTRKDNPKADIGPLAEKYISAGRALEAECDAQVYSLLEEFEKELRSKDFPADAAVKAREAYEAGKKDRAEQLLTIGKP